MDKYAQIYQNLQARYQLKWPKTLIDSFLDQMRSRLTSEEFTKAANICMQKESFFPAFDYFIEVIHGTLEQQAQQKRLAEVVTIRGEPYQTETWHIERLKAKIYVGRNTRSPKLIRQAMDEAIAMEINPDLIGGTENELSEIIQEASAQARAAPDAIQSGGVTLHRIGAIASRGLTQKLLDAD